MRGGHAGHLRRLNLERVQAFAMDRATAFTRAELIQATGLSAPTVGSLVSHLIHRGLVTDLGPGPSRGGRRPFFMEFNARYGFVAGIALSPIRTQLALADLRGERLAHLVMPTPPKLGPAALLFPRGDRDAARSSREAGLRPDRLLAIGAGAPGSVDPERGMVVALAPNLKGWSNVPMAATLRTSLGAPVIVENDVNLAVLGERWRGAARGHDNCAFMLVGHGDRSRDRLGRRAPPRASLPGGRDRAHVHGTAVRRQGLRAARLPRDARRPQGARGALAARAGGTIRSAGWETSSRPRGAASGGPGRRSRR
jgi:hypothetical protein